MQDMADETPGTADDLAALVLHQPGRLAGGSRLVCLDGPSGSGKTTLADDLARSLRERGCEVAVVHLDDVYDGWQGLPGVGAVLHRRVVDPLARGQVGSYRRYDWHQGRFAETRAVPLADVVVLEGVGAGHPAYAPLVSMLVWVEVPDDVGLARAVARDGAGLAERLQDWRTSEAALHTAERTRERADVVVDGLTGQITSRASEA